MLLQSGSIAPVFSLPDADMQMNHMGDLKGKSHLVLYFYPKDDTPGCTLEALEFSDALHEFEAAGSQVWGVSRDSCTSHGQFRDKHGLRVLLLADMEGSVCRQYGVWQTREVNGTLKEGVIRSTFLIDQQGVIRHALYDVKPKHHATDMLERVRAL